MKVIELSRLGMSPARLWAGRAAQGTFYALVHGEFGRGREAVVVPLKVGDFGQPAEGPARPGEYIPLSVLAEGEYKIVPPGVLARGEQDGHWLVLLRLHPGFRGGARYSVTGEAKVLAEGYEAQGTAGRMGGAPCPVVLVTGPCEVRWTRTGRLYGEPGEWTAKWDGRRWTVEPVRKESAAVAAAFE